MDWVFVFPRSTRVIPGFRHCDTGKRRTSGRRLMNVRPLSVVSENRSPGRNAETVPCRTSERSRRPQTSRILPPCPAEPYPWMSRTTLKPSSGASRICSNDFSDRLI